MLYSSAVFMADGTQSVTELYARDDPGATWI